MSRNGKGGDMNAQDIAALRQMGGPFIVRVQRRTPRGQLEHMAHWTDVTLDDLTGNMADNLHTYAGGGEYLLSVYTPEDKIKPKHTYTIIVPGEPRVPAQYKSEPAGAPVGSPQPGWPGLPGLAGMPGFYGGAVVPGWGPAAIGQQPGHPNMAQFPFGSPGMFPGLSFGPPAPGAPAPPPMNPAEMAAALPAMMIHHSMFQDTQASQRRAHRMEEMEEEERRERIRRERDRLWREEDRKDRAAEGGGGVGRPSAEFESLRSQFESLRALQADTKANAERQDAERRHAESIAALQRQIEEGRRDSERRADEADRRHREAMDRLAEQFRASAGSGGADHLKIEADRAEREERRAAEMHRWETEMRAREERWTAERQDRLRQHDIESRRWEAEARQREKDVSVALASVGKKDDAGILGALGGIFGQSQQGNSAMMQAMATMMAEAAKSRDLPEWMGKLITGGQSKSEEMQAVTQSASQLMSIAFGAMAQSMQQMAHMSGQGESPWVRVADRFFGEVGAVAEALFNKGGPQDEAGESLPPPRPALPAPPARPSSAPAHAAPRQQRQAPPQDAALAAEDYGGQDAEAHEAIPDDGQATVIDAEPASAAQTLQARLRQIKKAIRNGGLKAVQAARALIEATQFEIAYSGVLPEPFDQIEDDPAGVVDLLFGDWLREFGEAGEVYLATFKEWVAKFVKEGMSDEGVDAGKAEGDASGPPPTVIDVQVEPSAPAAPAPAEAPGPPAAAPSGQEEAKRTVPVQDPAAPTAPEAGA